MEIKKCFFEDKNEYCRHKKNNVRGQTPMKCQPNGCPYRKIRNNKGSDLKQNETENINEGLAGNKK